MCFFICYVKFFPFFDKIKTYVTIHLKARSNLVCVTEQRYVSRFLTRLWSVRISLISDTQTEILGFHVYKYKKKTKKQKWSKDREKWLFSWLVTSFFMYLKSIEIRTDHKPVKNMQTRSNYIMVLNDEWWKFSSILKWKV